MNSSTLTDVCLALLSLVIYDIILLLFLVAVVTLLSGTKRAAFAVMKRNFVGYFSNPTGYVFLCIFVFLTSLAAFWPYEFFNQNLATLDQLNYWFPLIMLIFIPAITMSIWSEEKRQGTDELLLTLPADDFDIVIGKYMAAASIFTASLLFSQISTFMTLAILTEGRVDVGLIFSSYLGYWFVGLTMIAIGMVASFLAGNLTVSFILGALFNAPLAFASLADSISPSKSLATWIASSGIARPFDDFGRGVISSSSVVYFIAVACVALYACMVLIGRRHWTGGKDGNTMVWHYLARVLALVLITIGAVVTFRSRDVVRVDLTEGKVSSLAEATKTLIQNLDSDRPIVIDAFISADIPEIYAQTRYELINLLKEFRSEAAKRNRTIEVNLYDGIELFSDDAALASERFGIEPVSRLVREKGAQQEKQLILGAAFKSGLEKVTIPIFEYGVPVEYELVRSINTVASGKRKRIGVVKTDASLMGGVVIRGMQMQQIPRHLLIDELAKQYDVEEVTLNGPVSTDMYRALICVQPSSLEPPQFNNLLDAIRSGMPVLSFEDPAPMGATYITPTGSPKQSPSPFGDGGQMIPKAEIRKLWDLLELDVPGTPGMQDLYACDLVWQQHLPYPALEDSADELWVFVDEDAPGVQEGEALSSKSPITSGMNEVLTLFPGGVNARPNSSLQHIALLATGELSGLLPFAKLEEVVTGRTTIAQSVRGLTPKIPIAMSIESPKPADPAATTTPRIKVVYVADTDLMLPQFSMLRADPENVAEAKFQFQNVTFVLNCIDWLTGEMDFIEVRKHEPNFASLRMIDEVKELARTEVRQRTKAYQVQYDEFVREAQESKDRELKKLKEELEKLQKDTEDGTVDQAQYQAKIQRFQMLQEMEQRKLSVKETKYQRERSLKIREIERTAAEEVTRIQSKVKAAAVVLPCIPPLIVGVVVFASRRLRERENISKSRLK
jgi:ABC-2 type transport system permease protein